MWTASRSAAQMAWCATSLSCRGVMAHLSAYYQGVHCKTFQGRTYARYQFDASSPGWKNIDEQWQDLKKKSRYARAVAQAGACENMCPAPNTKRPASICAQRQVARCANCGRKLTPGRCSGNYRNAWAAYALPAGVCDGGRRAALPGPCAADSPRRARPARGG